MSFVERKKIMLRFVHELIHLLKERDSSLHLILDCYEKKNETLDTLPHVNYFLLSDFIIYPVLPAAYLKFVKLV